MDRSDELDKFDILPSLIAAKDACANSHPLWKAIADALPVVWHKPFEESPQLTKLTKVIATDPEMALISLGRQRRDFGLCFHVLSETLETLMRDRVVPYDPGDAALASRVLESILRVGQNMSRLGREVSELCRQEGLTPTHVADIVEHDGGGSPGSQALSNQIREASVLRLVSLAVCMWGRS